MNLALKGGFITADQLREVLRDRAGQRGAGQDVPGLGEQLVNRGYISRPQFVALLEMQRRQPLGPPESDVVPGFHRSLGRFGKYFLMREIGRGGMGVVYEALDTVLDRRVALKMLRPRAHVDPADCERKQNRLITEAQLSARLPKHPHVVSVYEAGIIDGVGYVSAELIRGRSMGEWRTDAPLRRIVELLRDVALAVHHAHRHRIVHRDLKPENILVDGGGRPTVTDFGLAVELEPGSRVSATGEGFWVGTPVYMSPEQVTGSRRVDARTDVYALGVVLYESLAGAPPFQGDHPLDVMVRIARDPMKPPSSLQASADRVLERICMKALAKDPADRHATAAELAGELDAWLAGKRRAFGPARRRWALGGAAAALVLAVLAAMWFGRHRPVRPSPPLPSHTPPIGPAGMEPLGQNTSGALEFLDPRDGAVMVLVPAGEFTMGSDLGPKSEQPMRTVHVDAFLIDKTEVTVERFRRFVDQTGYVTEVERRGYALCARDGVWHRVSGASWRQPGYPQTDEHPVSCVSWEDASAYGRWAQKELPTEAQWEKAARGRDARKWPWGDTWDPALACLGAKSPVAAGSHPDGRSPWGILDLAGNVSELCADWWDDQAYAESERRNPKGPARGKTHVLRGGSWTDLNDVQLRSARRWPVTIDGNNADGFRTLRKYP